jgi:hypothetical protein
MVMNRFMQQQYVSMIVMLLLLTNPVSAAPTAIDADANKILRSMSSYLGSLSSFSMKANIEDEIVTDEGQKLQFSSFADIVINYPEKVNVSRKGMFADVEMIYDGKTFTLHNKKANVYIQRKATGTFDDAIRLVEFETDLYAPGADLFFTDSYSILKSGVTQAKYIGTTMFNGVECHHLAFRENKVDWQLWVKVGSEPLPMKYVITSKWVTAAPQYTVSFHHWNTKAKFPANQFKFRAPKGAKRIDAMLFNAIGEMQTDKVGR